MSRIRDLLEMRSMALCNDHGMEEPRRRQRPKATADAAPPALRTATPATGGDHRLDKKALTIIFTTSSSN
jgi:hypothetical protein